MATFYNQATLSYSGGTVSSNVATGELLEIISATKNAVNTTYSRGSDITYAVNVVNSSTNAVSNLTLTDNLGAYTFGALTPVPLSYLEGSIKYFVNGILQATPVVTATSPLTVTGISVPAEGVATILYTATANELAPPGVSGSITNTALISGGGITEISVNETITAAEEPLLNISKSVSPATVTENSELTYTFNIQNSGNTEGTASDSIIVSDLFDPLLSNITVTLNGTLLTQGTDYTYDTATGAFATTAGLITVPAATYTQDTETGAWSILPATATLTVSGTV